MTKEEILNNLQPIFRDIFNDDSLEISSDTTADDIDEWDSFNNISLIAAVEKNFNIKFDLSELFDLEDIGAMAELISRKI